MSTPQPPRCARCKSTAPVDGSLYCQVCRVLERITAQALTVRLNEAIAALKREQDKVTR